MNNTDALIVVDVQRDFCPGGSLPVPDGDKVVGVLNEYIELFSLRNSPVFASKDLHPKVTRHFRDYGGDWPGHCIIGTQGAEFHPDLILPPDAIIITKGSLQDEDAYSCFEARAKDGKNLKEILKEMNVRRIYAGGLATDYCVKQTVLDALKHGFKATLLIDAVKGVDINIGDSKRAVEEMKKNGAEMLTIEGFKKILLTMGG